MQLFGEESEQNQGIYSVSENPVETEDALVKIKTWGVWLLISGSPEQSVLIWNPFQVQMPQRINYVFRINLVEPLKGVKWKKTCILEYSSWGLLISQVWEWQWRQWLWPHLRFATDHLHNGLLSQHGRCGISTPVAMELEMGCPGFRDLGLGFRGKA